MKNYCTLFFILPIITLAQYPQMEYPLQSGNRWQYQGLPGEIINTTVGQDSMMSNGVVYKRFNGYQRISGSIVYSYNPTTATENILYDFSMKAGDTITFEKYPSDIRKLVLMEQYQQNVFGKVCTCMKYLEKSATSSAYILTTIADGYGIISFQAEAGSGFGLKGAIINGVTFGIFTSISYEPQSIPNSASLSQNYPNPFNPSTTIAYGIPERSAVRLSIFNTLGQKVSEIVNETKDAGTYEQSFTTSNLSSGIYFYRIEATSTQNSGRTFVETKKMMLMK